MSRPSLLRPIVQVALVSLLAVLTGCAGFTGTAVPDAAQATVPSGTVHGGQQPVTGAKVYLYAMSANGYGSASTNLLPENGFVTTDAMGNFTFVGLGVTCPAGNPQLYFLSSGGNPGQAAGTDNQAIQFVALLGPCSGVTGSASVTINEVSTIASATALQAFMDGGANIGSPSTNVLGLNNAVKAYSNLLNPGTGSALSRTPPANGANGAVPQAEINTLADILAPCANSTGPTSQACASLFRLTGTEDFPVASTLDAALAIAGSPGASVSQLFSLVTPTAPFQPTLPTAPNDFSIGVTYTGNNLVQPGVLVIDAQGNVWTANCRSCLTEGATDYIAKFGPTGNFINQYTSPGIHNTQGLAFDLSGNLWTANAARDTAPDQVTKMLSTGAAAGSYSGADLSGVQAVAVDRANNVWATSSGNSNLIILNQSVVETANSPLTPATTGLSSPAGIAFDTPGNAFIASPQTNGILKLTASGALPRGEPLGGYQASVLSVPSSIAIDSSNDVWTYNIGTNSIGKIGNTGVGIGNFLTDATLFQASLVSFDGDDVAWIPNCRRGCSDSGSDLPDSIVRVDSDGYLLDASDGLQNPLFAGTGSLAVDASGNVWVANSFGGSITQLLGLATPVVTPLAVATFSHPDQSR